MKRNIRKRKLSKIRRLVNVKPEHLKESNEKDA